MLNRIILMGRLTRDPELRRTGDGTPLPSFCGEPRAVTICGSQEDFTAAVWYGLHAENRVSLFTAFIDRRTGEVTTRIVNRNQNIGV